ncbi:hypothetical protein B0H67DRAFT_649252 [Lasiosphaeris hirsuta]|uniref:RING-type E3 ubiquitin transferase n=1 Tax=Lasiosphaeris hirsuta TaxID=260670 RepID=A0AA39ZWA1_9PEZI|nr:hypothetical protein B0H67DRAFT_649252 [Lasiosphaeris hirsuta]
MADSSVRFSCGFGVESGRRMERIETGVAGATSGVVWCVGRGWLSILVGQMSPHIETIEVAGVDGSFQKPGDVTGRLSVANSWHFPLAKQPNHHCWLDLSIPETNILLHPHFALSEAGYSSLREEASSTYNMDSMYCHSCHHQWQRASDVIECPACRSASTEIISPENDPRHFHNNQQPTGAAPDLAGPGASATPVPSQHPEVRPAADTLTGQPSNTNGNATSPGDAANSGAESQNPPHSHSEFIFMLSRPAMTFFTTVGSTGTDHTPPLDADAGAGASRGPAMPVYMGFHIYTPNFHLTPSSPRPVDTNSPPAGTEATTNQAPPPSGEPQQYGPAPPPDATFTPMGFMASLLSSLFNPGAAVLGDAAYTQEAFDRIISQLRDQSNPGGAPPASKTAIEKLEVRELDEEMMAGETTTRCVICVDEMTKGDKASVLPCSHFFHGECVTPWLKQHNTCPVCRRPIEEETGKPAKLAEFVQETAPRNTPNAADCP